MKYEIEVVNFGTDHVVQSEIAMLTGLELEEILTLSNYKQTWYGRDFVAFFQKAGYNCNNRFIKFDKNTQYPCMIRCHKLGVKNHWYGFIYYDGMIYLPLEEEVITWQQWNFDFPNYRVTSMLQVWI